MKKFTQNRRAILASKLKQGDLCLLYAKSEFDKPTLYKCVNKGELVSDKDYDLMIHSLGQRVAWMRNSIYSYQEAINMLKGLRQ